MNRIPPELRRPQPATGAHARPDVTAVPPGRRRRGGRGPRPWIVLGVVALVPALGLLALFSWSDGRIDTSEPAPSTPSTVVAPPLPPDPLANGVMSFRRLPAIVSRGLNVEVFERDAVPFLASVNDRSCAAISVDGQPVGSRNGDLAVIPASNQKLLVAAVALDVLGPDAAFRTDVLTAAEPVNGVVDGDLVLRGGGDPVLTSSWYPTSDLERFPVFNETSLDALADAVVERGVTEIRGDVVGDGSRYDDEFFAPGWGTGVAGLEAGPYDALLVNDSRVLGEDRRADDPNRGAAREFARLLRERGVVIAGGDASGSSAALGGEPVEIAAIDSAPLTAIVEEMLVNSDNNTAELLVKEIGRQATQADVGTREDGTAAMTSTLEGWGIDTGALAVVDGSGLGLGNRVTCDALLAVLQRFDPAGPIGQGLPLAGRTGALADVFVGHPVEGRLRGKTGTLNNPPFNADPPAVKALAGYLPVDGGGAVEYVLILNGPTISDQSEYRPIWSQLADALATYPSGPSPAEIGIRT